MKQDIDVYHTRETKQHKKNVLYKETAEHKKGNFKNSNTKQSLKTPYRIII